MTKRTLNHLIAISLIAPLPTLADTTNINQPVRRGERLLRLHQHRHYESPPKQ